MQMDFCFLVSEVCILIVRVGRESVECAYYVEKEWFVCVERKKRSTELGH